MTTRLELAIFLWTVIAVSATQCGLLTWLLWPKLRRHFSCSWCWRVLHVQHLVADRYSSGICAYHERQMLAQSAMRRAARIAQARAALAETVEAVGQNQEVRV